MASNKVFKNILLVGAVMLSSSAYANASNGLSLLDIKKAIVYTMKDNEELKNRISKLEKEIRINKSQVKIKKHPFECMLEQCDYIVNKWEASIREEPEFNSKKVDVYKFGTLVNVKKIINKEWAELENGNYIATKCINEVKPTKLITTRKSNIRNRPYINEKTYISRVSKNIKLDSYGHIGIWYVLENGKLIHSSNVKVVK